MRKTPESPALSDDDCQALEFLFTPPFLFPPGFSWNRCRGDLEAGRFLPAGGASVIFANSYRTERRRARRPSLESNAIGKVFHHMELNTTSELRAGGAPY
jgi:hypothetical protein